jgi:HPt (histidine-containing phosphotransfer) domain-containing protein
VTVFDPALVEDAFEDDLQGLSAFVRSVLSSLQSGVQRVRDAIEARDAPAIRAAAHAVKGSSSHLGAAEVGRHAALIEDAAREGRVQNTKTVDALARAVGALEAIVEDYLKSRGSRA